MDSKQAKINEILEDRNRFRSLDVDAMEDYSEEPIPDPSPRFTKLMDIYYVLKNTIDMEYPYWYNRTWWQNDGDLPEIRRAKSEAAALSHMTPTIWPGELLVMNKTKNWRGAFCFPWVDASFFNAQAEALLAQADAPALSAADSVSQVGAGGGNVTKSFGNVVSIAQKFGLRKEEIPVLVKVARYWMTNSVEVKTAEYSAMIPDYYKYKSYRDTVLVMFDSWAIPQGREVMNYYMPLEYGFDRLLEMCDEKIADLLGEADNGDGVLGMSRGYYYIAMKEIIKGLIQWAENYAKRATFQAELETDPQQKKDYEDIAVVMHNIAHKQPSSFREALQLTFLLHLAVVNEDPQSGQSIGRIGQVLQPFYAKDLREGKITEEDAIELLELYRIKITSIECFASSGVTGGVLSGNTFNNLGLGGLGLDGLTAVTPLEYLIVEAGTRGKTTQPTLSVLYDEKTPEDFLMKAARCCKGGMGYPAWMNNQTGMNYMLRNYHDEDMTVEDARAWMLGGCLESSPGTFLPLHYDGKVTMVPGGAGPTAGTGIHFTGLPKMLELVLTNGRDVRTGIQVFEPHNNKLETLQDVWDVWSAYMEELLEISNRVNNIQMDIWRKINPPTVASLLKPDCFAKGQTLSNMGCRYNATINFESCGTVTFINAMASLKKNVYDEKKYTIEEMTDALLNNFGFKTAFETGVFSPDHREATEDAPKYEKIFFDCVNAPKFGNADPYVDSLMVDYEILMKKLVPACKSYMGKPLYMCQISVSTHGPQGAITLADAGGRLAGTTYSDGSVSAAAATDKNGIYAVFESATCYDHSMCQNAQMNVKIHPTAVKGAQGTRKLLDVIRAYMRKGGFHVQFNITSSKVLRAAQQKPEEYRDLMVRVAGFTQYWCEIGKPIQDEVIYRTEYDQ
ncbi:Formate C-acetyltransferase [Olsenella uli DSM 7084]|uniref:Formate C-acetyltransferase n=1 Tax=Olsenella uli (strain ATCC 49627 / DSM 7084 / CCUG 31166 / CIP 109912 / JCM 12494 / LMG 11480 / NCIMB 702895 / VPI D76D-27C) TaxID=633147 RepID=E1QVI8_OLSUV|nr:4-hydroxyphenylacetate decarboxylase large subunit [Olsenella uli]ADK68141.1 Formate C-acetyltransferase [Olsenella uli DSM 7084]EUB32611.1 glycine radical domain protein [Olsenella uli MSTE5]KRO13062.1 Formate C-acetyltransferase [Olsenella uli DSM 7084]MBS6418377.1 4-hydroxyphenylacetate decarboxylase large subunit [Olsenella uli]